MADYPQTGSTLYQSDGVSNKTSTALSTNIIIKVAGVPVGAIQNINITETRNIKMIQEVGTDGNIDSVPQAATSYSVECTRIRFDKLRIAQAFNRGFIHAQSQRYPFDIYIYDVQSEDASNHIITILKNCWINRIGYNYTSSDWVISETMGLNVETIYSSLTGGEPVGDLKNPRDISGYVNVVEREADVGQRRGSLDAKGLIDLTGGF